MKISGGMTEGGIVVGNAYDKYGSRNPLVRRIMRRFEEELWSLVEKVAPRTLHEIGCGEGYWTIRWRQQGILARGSDTSSRVIELARANALEQGVPGTSFEVRSIYDMEPGRDGADLVVCCEVLEHLERPEEGLRVLRQIAGQHVIVSVPREPLWRMLNMARGKYLLRLGNTPGHIQHWSRDGFVRFVQRHFDVEEVRSPLPWTMLLCRVRS